MIASAELHRPLPRLAGLLAVAVLVWVCATGAAAAQGAGPTLRQDITVDGDIVTLGDLFQNAGGAADVPVFRSPDLGTQGVVAAKRVAAAALRHGLNWTNPDAVDQITVRRPSRLISTEEIALLLRDRIATELGSTHPESIEVDLQRNARPLHMAPQNTEPLIVKRLHFDPRSGRFHAVIGLQVSNRDTPDQTYQGRAIETVEIAMPVRTIERGATIAARDIGVKRMPRTQVASNMVVERDALIGMAASRHLSADRPVRHSDIERPKLVTRNSIVAIIYRVPGLVLKATGRALGEGALGESVPVLNTQSKQTIYAEVAGPGEVSVSTESPAIAKRVSTAPGNRYLVR